MNKIKIIIYNENTDLMNIINNNENKDLNKSIKKMLTNNIDYSDYFKLSNQKSAKNLKLKLNFSDLNKYLIQNQDMQDMQDMNNLKNLKNFNNSLYKNKSHRLSELDIIKNNKINSEKNNIDNNILKHLYNNRNDNNDIYIKNINHYNNSCHNHIIHKYNSFSHKCNKNLTNNDNINNDIKKIYNETGANIDSDINNNIKKIKNNEELIKLKNILENLKLENQMVQTELSILQNQNFRLEQKQNDINRKIFKDIKNINLKNLNNINDIKDIPIKDKIEFIRDLFLDEKLKNSLIEKTYDLFSSLNSNNNIKNNTNININNIWKWITVLIKEIDKLKKINKDFKKSIKNKTKEDDIYKIYYSKWMKLFGVNNKKDLRNKIRDLINDQYYNDNEEVKLFNILMKKKP